MSQTGLKVKAPATVSNLACGYDVLGLAIDVTGDEIIGHLTEKPGVRINQIYGVKGKLPTDPEKNTAGIAVSRFLQCMRASKVGIEIDIYKKLPLGTGLGSSASSAAAAVMLVNELLRRPLSKRELVPFAVLGEMGADGALHGDNVIPSLLGGVILIRDIRELDYHRVYHPANLYLSVVLPNVSVLTREARQILKDDVPMKKYVRQSGNLGGLLLGLQNSDFDLIERSLQDHIIEPQRAHLIPHFYEIQTAALEAGALGCSISGSGPTIFALSNERMRAEQIGEEMQRVFNQNKIDSRLYVSAINDEGTVLC